MIELEIKSNRKEIVADMSRYVGEQQKAVVRALNKTAISARAEASKEVRLAGYNLKASAIKASFSIKKANADNLVVVLKATGSPIALINYGANQTKAGVSFKVKAGRQVMRHAFIATMKNGHVGVFERVGNARIKGAKGSKILMNGKRGRANLPIKELYGPSIPDTLGNSVVSKAIMKKINETFPKILAAELNFISLKG